MDSEVVAPPEPVRDRRSSGLLLIAGAILISGLAIAAGLMVQGRSEPARFRPAGAIGSFQTVTLNNGQVFFGRLKAVEHDSLVMNDVFEAVTNTDPKTNQQTTRLVLRRVAEWHGPLDMSIPLDKVLMVESIGPDSSVSKGMEAAGVH